MKIEIKKINESIASVMRSAGYVFQRAEREEMSFIRPLARQGYPRFHAYVRKEGLGISINLHLDQKKNTYGENTRHHGEYRDGGPLGQEAQRIKDTLG